jgi:hypothetical protein
VVFGEGGKVVVATAFDADKGDFVGIDLLKVFAVAQGNQAILCAVDDIGMAVYAAYPFIGAQFVPEYEPDGEKGKKAFHHFGKTIIGGFENEVAGLVVGGDFGGKAAADAAPVDEYIMLRVLGEQLVVDKLHIAHDVMFAAFAGAFAKAAIIDQHHIVIIPVKIAGIFGPSFYAAGIAVEVKDQSFGMFPVKMQAIDANAGADIEKQFFEGNIVFKQEVLAEFFGLKNKPVLYEIRQYGKQDDTEDDIQEYVDGHTPR